LVPVLALAGLGAGRVGEFFGLRAGKWGGLFGASLPVLLYLVLAWPPVRLLQTRPYSPSREVAAYLKERSEEHAEGILAVGYGLGGEMQRVYCPDVRHAVSRADIERYTEEAARTGRALFLYYGYDSFNRATLEDGFALIDDAELFREVAAYRGIESEFYFHVMEYPGDG
jgi:hypothetical protein